MRSRAWLPLAFAALGLLGAAGVAVFLYRAATGAIDAVLAARLASAGETTAALLPASADGAHLAAVMRANALDGAYLVGRDFRLLADARGPAPAPVDLLRTDPERLARAFAGQPSVSSDYALGELAVLAGYFPVGPGPEAVLVLEAGEPFAAPRRALGPALALALVLALGAAGALALAAARHQRSERLRRRAEVEASRGEGLARLAAVAAHEIRNPLSVIQATVELLRERLGERLDERGHQALLDVLGEVQRLRRLTEDLLDLSAQRPLQRGPVELGALLAEVARTAERTFPGVRVALEAPDPLALDADGARLRQVFANLVANAAQAQGEGQVTVRAGRDGATAVVRVEDQGPGVPEALRASLFELFVTTREGGTGLGLAISRRLVEAHGGTLALVPSARGATFEVRLPRLQEAMT